jgi:hypothetical protein
MDTSEKQGRALHDLARKHDWRGPIEPMIDAARNKHCNLGTALLIYWRADPVTVFKTYGRARSRVPAKDRPRYELLLDIQDKYEHAFYWSDRFRFDPGNDRGTDLTRPRTRKALKRRIPAYLFGPYFSRLHQMTPQELHEYVEHYNWDWGEKQMLAAARSRSCDLGTALMIYWEGVPTYYFAEYATRKEVPPDERAGYDLLVEVERKVVSGFYRKHEVRFNPGDWLGHDLTELSRGDTYKRTIPQVMFGPHYRVRSN